MRRTTFCIIGLLAVTSYLTAVVSSRPEIPFDSPTANEMELVLGGCISCYNICANLGCQSSACGESDVGEWCGTAWLVNDTSWKCLAGYGSSTLCDASTGTNVTCFVKKCTCGSGGAGDCDEPPNKSNVTGKSECSDS